MLSFVYVLGCRTRGRNLTYVGWTIDVAARLTKHNAGTGARSTRGRAWTLLHVEEFHTRQEAMSREWHLKRDRKFRKQLAFGIGSSPVRTAQTADPHGSRGQPTKNRLSSANTGSRTAPDQSI
jgi:putative endonuclease